MAVAIVAAVGLLIALAILVHRMGDVHDEERRIASVNVNRDEQLRERERWEAARNPEVADHYDRARKD